MPINKTRVAATVGPALLSDSCTSHMRKCRPRKLLGRSPVCWLNKVAACLTLCSAGYRLPAEILDSKDRSGLTKTTGRGDSVPGACK